MRALRGKKIVSVLAAAITLGVSCGGSSDTSLPSTATEVSRLNATTVAMPTAEPRLVATVIPAPTPISTATAGPVPSPTLLPTLVATVAPALSATPAPVVTPTVVPSPTPVATDVPQQIAEPFVPPEVFPVETVTFSGSSDLAGEVILTDSLAQKDLTVKIVSQTTGSALPAVDVSLTSDGDKVLLWAEDPTEQYLPSLFISSYSELEARKNPLLTN